MKKSSSRSNPVHLVYATFPDLESAEATGQQLIDKKLVACVNILPTMVSLFNWQGERQRVQEVVMVAKAPASLAVEVTDAVNASHPYDLPAVVSIEIASGSLPFLNWVNAETGVLSS